MELKTCPHCGVQVAVLNDGTCPSCRESFDEPNESTVNPYASPTVAGLGSSTATAGLTLGEKVYLAFVILCAGFLLVSAASFHFLIIPGSDDPEIFYFIVSIIWLDFFALGITTALNLYQRQLAVIPTIIQIVLLCLMVYFLPVGIAGIVLLYRRAKRKSERPVT